MADVFRAKMATNRAVAGLFSVALAIMLAIFAPAQAAAASGVPSGERSLGQSTAEPVYNDITGSITYINTPNKAPLHANPAAWAPIYIVVYPASAAGSIGTVQCAHIPADNCPDHGPAVAGAAAQIVPSIYGDGVWGHDHLLAPPASGGDFNIAWEPILVLFTDPAATTTHITTLAQINAVTGAHQAIKVPLPSLTFHCEVVPAVVYWNGAPVTPV